ncbi:MAG: hypothetical protein R3Y67_09400 [Eubacteriales bacterium]
MLRKNLLLIPMITLTLTGCANSSEGNSEPIVLNSLTVKEWNDDTQDTTTTGSNEDLELLEETSEPEDSILEEYTFYEDSSNSSVDNVTSQDTTTDAGSNTDETGIDLDLTTLSATMLYAEVFNIVMYPDEYLGKTIKMTGSMSVYEDTTTGIVYFATIISDSTACCMQGIEFVLTEDYSYPEDYPEHGMNVTVAGEFETYEENGFLFCRLKNATLL